jgi:hypothetical protein
VNDGTAEAAIGPWLVSDADYPAGGRRRVTRCGFALREAMIVLPWPTWLPRATEFRWRTSASGGNSRRGCTRT